jgi:hypothetical protein
VKCSSLSRAAAALAVAALVAAVLALPGTTIALTSSTTTDQAIRGHYKGDGVFLYVGNAWGGNETWIEMADYKHTSFHRLPIHDGSFQGCTRVPIGGPFFRDFCIHGTFGEPGHAAGTIRIYFVDQSGRNPNPYETHHWKAGRL